MTTTELFDSIIVIGIYRSPALSMASFHNQLLQFVVPIIDNSHHRLPVLILGDFNVSTLTAGRLPIPYSQYISAPACITGSLLDHVYWSGVSTVITTDVIGCYFSDHFIVSVVIDETVSIPNNEPLIPTSSLLHLQCRLLAFCSLLFHNFIIIAAVVLR